MHIFWVSTKTCQNYEHMFNYNWWENKFVCRYLEEVYTTTYVGFDEQASRIRFWKQMKSIEPQKSICSSGWEGSGVRPLVIVSSGNIDTPRRGLKKVHTLLSEEVFGYNQCAIISYDIKINYLFILCSIGSSPGIEWVLATIDVPYWL